MQPGKLKDPVDAVSQTFHRNGQERSYLKGLYDKVKLISGNHQ